MKDWLKLDNAATIYPASITRNYQAMFRISMSLIEDVDKDILGVALKNVMKRFSTFNYSLKEGLFWCYFDYINDVPLVQEDYKNPMVYINFKKNRNYLFRVRYYKNRVSLEVFHALTDGYGGVMFLSTLVGEYLRIKYNLKIHYNDVVLNPRVVTKENEYEDLFNDFINYKGSLKKESYAFHIKGTNEKPHILNVITGTININDLKSVSSRYNCTITEFLTSVLIYSYQEIKFESYKSNNLPIKISIPINLRNIYNKKTMRNFSSFINVPFNKYKGSLEDIINEVRYNFKTMIDIDLLNSKLGGNVRITNNFFIRRIPMFIKKHIISIVENIMGDGYITSTLSNIGLIKLPSNMDKYVEDMSFILGRSKGITNLCGVIGYKDNIYISFSRKIKETSVERIFFKKLVELGIDVTIEGE